jgi:hypothetical protein
MAAQVIELFRELKVLAGRLRACNARPKQLEKALCGERAE